MIASVNGATSVVYVRLLDEGVDWIFRPVPATRTIGEAFLLDPTFEVPDDETWEFLPGAVVICESRDLQGRRELVAIRIVSDDDPRDQAGDERASTPG